LAGEKPTAAFVLGLIGGIFILLGALAFLALSAVAGSILSGIPGAPTGASSVLMIYSVIGLIFALLVIIGSVMLYMRPHQHVMWGVVVLLFSLFSIIVTGGFFIGLILGLVGGILGIVFKPSMPMAAPYAPPMAPPPQ
jgi:hypothetical protein